MMFLRKHPDAIDAEKVGSYPAEAYSGGGYFYDDVLEYRVWLKDGRSASYYAFPTYKAAQAFHATHSGSEKPVVLVRQNSYIEEDGNNLRQINKQRITEWDISWLKGNKGTKEKIPSFIAKYKSR